MTFNLGGRIMKLFHKKNLIMPLIILVLFSVNYSLVHGEDTEKVYKFAGDTNHPPYEYIDNEGNFKGFSVDIIKAIADKKDIEIEIIPMEWNEAVLALDNGEVDGLIGMSQNKERLTKYRFISPTLINNQVIFVHDDTIHINETEDLIGTKVAYQKNDINESVIRELPNVEIFPMAKQEDTLIALQNKEVDAALGNRLVGIYHIQRKKMAESIKIVGEPLTSSKYGPVVRLNDIEVYEILEDGLQGIKEDKTYDKIHDRWFGTDINSIGLILNLYRNEIIIIISSIFIIFIFLYLYNKRLQKQVLKRTRELEQANRDLVKQQNEIYNLAYYDTVTLLPNRAYFVEELNNKFENIDKGKEKFAILLLDLDRFKHINDTLGHNVGDQILKLLGIRLSKLLGEDDIVARIGGDEYFILVSNIHGEYEAVEVAQRILESFKEPFHIQSYELHLTTSIGIAVYPEGGLNSQDMVKNADLALYKAKDNGGNSCYLYGGEIASKGLERMMLLSQLRQAIEDDQLVLHYQPQVDINTDKIIGLEALIRWNHPDKGLLYPDQFIPLAEETGLIIELGRWVLKRATRQAKEWIDNGHDIIISVNISPKEFQYRGFIRDVIDSLTETKLNPENLTLEITETTAISDIDYTLSVLRMLRSFGVSVAIDDFGTGYSSLNYLNEMSVNGLKIDRSFIWDIEKNTKNKMISNTIILLGKQLGLKVTAEGVENAEQLAILKELKCDIAQGYHFSRPASKEEIDKLIEEYETLKM